MFYAVLIVQGLELCVIPAQRSHSAVFCIQHWRSRTRVPAGKFASIDLYLCPLVGISLVVKRSQFHSRLFHFHVTTLGKLFEFESAAS